MDAEQQPPEPQEPAAQGAEEPQLQRVLTIARTRLGFAALREEAVRRVEAERLLGHELEFVIASPVAAARRTATGKDNSVTLRLAGHLADEIAERWQQAGLRAEPRLGEQGFEATVFSLMRSVTDPSPAAVMIALPPPSMGERLHLRRQLVARLRTRLTVPILPVATPEYDESTADT